MKHIGLFEGIGGFSLAAEWMGWETLAWCESNEFCQKVLKYHFPNAEGFGDIKKTDFTKYANRIDILTGGFPCQPFSTAGEQLGEDDERFIFHEMFRAIKEIQPKWIVAENVFGLTSKKFSNTLEAICASLENEGYEIQSVIIPASAVKARHERNRLWIVAHSNGLSGQNGKSGKNRQKESESKIKQEQWERIWNGINGNDETWNVTNSKRIRQSGSGRAQKQMYSEKNENWKASWSYDDGRWPTQPPVCIGNDGISNRLDGITFQKWQQESIKCAGNAIVPQVAFDIFKTIEQYENLTNPYPL